MDGAVFRKPYLRWTADYVSISLTEAARRGVAWAVRRLASWSHASEISLATVLTAADRSFLRWLAKEAVALYLLKEKERMS